LGSGGGSTTLAVCRAGLSTVESRQPWDVDSLLDVAADAPLAEGDRHPGLEMLDDPRPDAGVLVEVVVEPVGESIHELLQPWRALCVLRLKDLRIGEQLAAQVEVDRGLAVRLRPPTERLDVVGLDPVEVVLGLRVLHAEYRIGVGFAVYVGDAPIVTVDGDALRLPIPAGDVGGARRLRRTGQRAGAHCQKEEQSRD
jgi:hypothetical protein